MQKLSILLLLLLLTCGVTLAQDEEKSGFDIALERIEEARQSGKSSLTLTWLDLTQLPPEIGQLTELEHLNLSSNDLIELPSEIGQLKKLKYLELPFNNLKELPPEIAQLNDLRYLSVEWNELTELPSEIGQLEKLCYLDLSVNQLTSLPIELERLTQLTKDACNLDLAYNSISFPPPEIIKQGTPAILDYLRNKAQREDYQRRMTLATGGVGFGLLIAMVLGLRWRGRRMGRKSKRKNDEI